MALWYNNFVRLYNIAEIWRLVTMIDAMNYSNIHNNIKFRTSFINTFGLSDNVERKERFEKIFQSFGEKTFNEATKILIKLLYGTDEEKESALNIMGLTMNPKFQPKGIEADILLLEDDEPQNNSNIIAEEKIATLANELRFQYQKKHPAFLQVQCNDERYIKELDALKKSMSNDPLLFFRAVEFCRRVSETKPQADYCIKLMRSEKANEQFNGLRNMGHNKMFAALLEPYSRQIADLLESMSKIHEEDKLLMAEPNLGSTPFAGLAEMLQNEGITLSDDQQAQMPEAEQTSIEEEALTSPLAETENLEISTSVRNYTQNRELIETYFSGSYDKETLKALRSAGIDLNEICDKEELIISLFENQDEMVLAMESFGEGALGLHKAQSAFNEAQAQLDRYKKEFAEVQAKLLESQAVLDETRSKLTSCMSNYTESNQNLVDCQKRFMAIQAQLS